MNNVVQLKPSQSIKPTVNEGRAENTTYRSREHLTEAEIEKLITTAGKGRNPDRDRLLVRMSFLHALRVSELVGMKWDQIDLKAHTVFVRRVKGSVSGIHGLDGDELRLLRALRRENPHGAFVFMSERKAPMSVDGAQKLIERLGEAAGMPFQIHAHMLRHSTGFALAGRGVDTRSIQVLMGHKNIQNTTIYTAVADKRIRTIWDR